MSLPTLRGMTERSPPEAIVKRGEVSLATRLSFPQGQPQFPCVIFVHGLGSSKESPRNVVIAQRLVDAGIAALLFDLSGHGEASLHARGGGGQRRMSRRAGSSPILLRRKSRLIPAEGEASHGRARRS